MSDRLRAALETVEAVERELDDVVITQLSFTDRLDPEDTRRVPMMESIQSRLRELAGDLAVASRVVKLELDEQRNNAVRSG